MILPLIIAAVVGYLLGSLPFGYWVARAHGVNIFEVGSKNPGATNVRRVLGKGPGNWVFTLDALKGGVAASWVLLAGHLSVSTAFDEPWSIFNASFEGRTWLAMGVVGILAAIVGHSFSIFMKFRGGKGVATTTGGFLVLMPIVITIGAAVWGTTFFTSRYVSLASIFAALALPIAAFLLDEPGVLQILALIIALFVVFRHRSNIVRLLNGTESRFQKKGSK